MRILIAEDHPDNREMLTRRLERKGYEVHCAENGAEAVEMAKSCAPDLILMDISMPVMSGIEATRVIRATPDVRNIKIVALDTINATGQFLHPAAAMLTEQGGKQWLRVNAPVQFSLRRGREATSALVREVGGAP